MSDDPRIAALLAARLARRQIDGDLPPIAGEDDAYEIQDGVMREIGPLGGWKVGAKSPTARPTCAPIPAAALHRSPTTLPACGLHMIGIEAELAFRFARGFAPSDPEPSLSSILDAIASVHAAIEVVDTRLADWRQRDRLWLLADNQMNAGLVYGDPAADWPRTPLDRVPVRLTIDGRARVEQVGGNPGGDPIRLLSWLVGHAWRRRGGLADGALVTTGSFTGLIFVEPCARVEAEFPGIGSAVVSFSAG